eukprot:TRINITY_DN820_c0_g2_i1.p1 TRINITY_DN820_c0_g2~~TRINITY_DN820_c0_g2_i1.p1  ORF type:complete len:178 (+),score=19.02 TRINITY_DN820_c0_g2_i1:65-598(+)
MCIRDRYQRRVHGTYHVSSLSWEQVFEEAHNGQIFFCAFVRAGNSSQVVSAGADKFLKLWEFSRKECLWSIDLKKEVLLSAVVVAHAPSLVELLGVTSEGKILSVDVEGVRPKSARVLVLEKRFSAGKVLFDPLPRRVDQRLCARKAKGGVVYIEMMIAPCDGLGSIECADFMQGIY